MEEYITNQHHYYTLNYYLRKKFGKKVFKVALNGNFSCPNRDGKVSTQGCFFCSSKGSGDFAGDPNDSLEKQFKTIKDLISLKWPNSLYIAYFQANSNTYGPLSRLKELYEKAISLDENIVGLSIATRCDCINDETAKYLGTLNKKIPIWIELGLQTTNVQTMKEMNLGYNLETFNKAVSLLRNHNLEVIVHIINGFPNDSEADMINNIIYINNLDIQGIKIHSLFVLKNTILGDQFLKNPFKILSLEEYVSIVVKQIRLLRKDIVIHRINGDAPINDLIEPKWSIKKMIVMNEIDKCMKENNYYQGDLWKK